MLFRLCLDLSNQLNHSEITFTQFNLKSGLDKESSREFLKLIG
jgi:hypothetical protein